MHINVEFFDTEPIENLITCIHHKMDKVIYFGYEKVIKKYEKRTRDFLEKYCENPIVEFHAIETHDLNKVIEKISEVVEKVDTDENTVYFDITGGESLFLVAFGVLADKLKKPMHMYDIENDQLIHLGNSYGDHVGNVNGYDFEWNLYKYIEMSGAKIDKERMDKSFVDDEAFMSKVDVVWDIVKEYRNHWNDYASVFRDKLNQPDSLDASGVVVQKKQVNIAKFYRFAKKLEAAGVLSYVKSEPLSWNQKGWITESKFSITYADYKWKDGLTKIGTILELRVYKDLKDAGKEVLQSVHIDWDGVLESEQKKSLVPEQQKVENVLNEIDVLTLEGIIPTFISCKCGNMDQGKALTPMYELETVATRFGGKYSKKRLATLKEVTGAYAERAEEMGIELWCCE